MKGKICKNKKFKEKNKEMVEKSVKIVP